MLLRYALLLCICIGIIFHSVSQNKEKEAISLLNQYREADQYYNRALNLSFQKDYSEEEEERLNKLALENFRSLNKILPKHFTFHDSLQFFIILKMGELEHYFENLPQALRHYQQAIQLKTAALSDSFLFKPYVFSGIICYNQNKFDSAALFFSKAENIQNRFSIALAESERLYNNLGVLYYESGNYQQASNYFQKAAELLPRHHPYYRELYVNYNINIATALYKMEQYDAAHSILQKLLPYNILTNEINNNIGLINLYLGSSTAAIDYFKKTNYTNRLRVGLNNDIANAFLNLKQYDSARKYLLLAQDENEKYYGKSPNVNNGLTLKYLGDLHAITGTLENALNFYQKALHQLYPAYGDTVSLANPEKYSGVFSYINLFQTLIAKAEVLHKLFLKTQQAEWAKKELATYHSAFALTDYVEHTYDSDEARLFLNRIKYVVHNKPIAIAYALFELTKDKNYLEQAYLFDQKNKASVLSFNQFYIATTNNPQWAKEKEIKAKITRLSLKAGSIKDSAELVATNRAIRDYEIELGRLQQKAPGALKVTERIPSIKNLQRGVLDDQSMVLSYHLSDSTLIALMITQDSFTVHQQKLYEGFDTDLQLMIHQLREATDRKKLKVISKRLYHFLIAYNLPVLPHRLIIIPDDELNYLPFEALQDSTGKFLIEQASVQYQYATALLSKQDADLSNSTSIGFAPFSDKGFHFAPFDFARLPQSREEIKTRKGIELFDSAATKMNFIQRLSERDIIHLATHAVASDQVSNQSYIAFYPTQRLSSDYLLYAPEIYNLDLKNTQLIILSACETGAGNLVKGEGIMSLSRAFAYAGCANIITSLWKADDASTALLAQSVQQYLQKKYSIAEALRQAKIDYLKNNEINPRMKHPTYWAHLVFIGNYQSQPTRYEWLFFGSLVIILIVAGILIIKKARHRPG